MLETLLIGVAIVLVLVELFVIARNLREIVEILKLWEEDPSVIGSGGLGETVRRVRRGKDA